MKFYVKSIILAGALVTSGVFFSSFLFREAKSDWLRVNGRALSYQGCNLGKEAFQECFSLNEQQCAEKMEQDFGKCSIQLDSKLSDPMPRSISQKADITRELATCSHKKIFEINSTVLTATPRCLELRERFLDSAK